MSSLIELALALAELLDSWRLLAGLAVTLAAVAAIVWVLPAGAMAWVAGAPIAVLGVFLSFRWQIRADEDGAL